MELGQRLYNGDRAREVLENEAYIAAFADIEKDLIESWKNTPATNANRDARERIHMALTLMGKVQACLHQTLDTGKLAKMELEHQNKLQEIAKRAKSAMFG